MLEKTSSAMLTDLGKRLVSGSLSDTAIQAATEATPNFAILPWVTVVWNDPINLMTYVTFVFQKLFGYSKAKATQLMLQVHNEGKAVVSSGTREKAEHDVARLHGHGLWATMQRD